MGRLIILEGADAPANRISMNLLPETAEPTVGCDYQQTAVHCIAHMNWITTGDWRYARAHHAVCRVWEECGKVKKPSRQGWVFFSVKNGEPVGYELRGDGPLKDYWYTYFGDDLCLEWASLTGDPAAVDALLLQAAFYTRDEPVSPALYCSPEALLTALAHVQPAHPHLAGVLRHRLWAHAGMRSFVSRRPAVSGRYASAEDWARLGDGMGIFGSQGKNGLSIHGAEAMEILFWMHAWKKLGHAAPPAP